MDALPTRLEKLDEHLDELSSNPETPIDAVLFDHVELQVTGKQPCLFFFFASFFTFTSFFLLLFPTEKARLSGLKS